MCVSQMNKHNNNDYISTYKALEISNNGDQVYKEYNVAKEATFDLIINDIKIASILTSPSKIKELGIGYIVCEGIAKAHEIKSIELEGTSINAQVENSDDVELWQELRSSGCIGFRWENSEEITIDSNTLFHYYNVFNTTTYLKSGIHSVTRGTHLAALIDSRGNLISSCVDIGRHNAIDKVVGEAILNKIELSSSYLLSTGRQSAGMVLKVARAGIPLLVTKSAPLDTGIDAAIRTGLCLIGFLSTDKMTIFANEDRISFTTNGV